MSGRRRFTALLAAVLTCLVALVAGASSSQAVPGYKPHPHISLSSTNVTGCATLTVTGTDFTPKSKVTLTLHSKVYTLTTVTADASGNFTTSVTVPAGVNGTHTIVANGIKGETAQASLTISGCAGIAGVGTQGGNGGLSATGVAVISLAGLGFVLLVGGLVLVLGGRRRRALA